MDPLMTIPMLVLITFVAGIVGGLVIADAYDLDPYEKKREKRRAKRKARRMASRKNVNFTIDKF